MSFPEPCQSSRVVWWLNEEVPENTRYDTLKTHQMTTQSLRWRGFIWKNHIGYFITPKIKSKQNQNTHIFWKCAKIPPFWNNIQSAFCEVIPRSCLVLYLYIWKGLCYKQWLFIIDDTFVMEKLSYKLKMKEERFKKDSGKWSTYKTKKSIYNNAVFKECRPTGSVNL